MYFLGRGSESGWRKPAVRYLFTYRAPRHSGEKTLQTPLILSRLWESSPIKDSIYDAKMFNYPTFESRLYIHQDIYFQKTGALKIIQNE